MKSWYYKPRCFKKHTQRSSFAIQPDLEIMKILKVKLKSSNQTPNEFILSKVIFQTASSSSIVQGFSLLFRNTFFKENFSVVASVILHRFYFSNTKK